MKSETAELGSGDEEHHREGLKPTAHWTLECTVESQPASRRVHNGNTDGHGLNKDLTDVTWCLDSHLIDDGLCFQQNYCR